MAALSFDAANFPLSITTGLGPNAFLLTKVRGREAISALFHYKLELKTDPALDVPFDKVLGEPATVRISAADGGSRLVSGIVTRFRQVDADEDHATYHAELSPHLWLLTRSVQSRAFQQLNVPDILKQVFGTLKVSWRLARDYPTMDFCVQYGESDFAFASRLMESVGIYYYFQHDDNEDTLVVSDRTDSYPDLPGGSTLAYNRLSLAPGQAAVSSWRKSQALGAAGYTVSDYHFQVSRNRLESAATLTDEVNVGTIKHRLKSMGREVFDAWGGYARRHDGIGPKGEARPQGLNPLFDEARRMARLWMDREAAACLDVGGKSNYAQLQPGYQIHLTRHSHASGDYLITRVKTDATMSGFRSGEDPVLTLATKFNCLPASLPFRPPCTTAKPIIFGPQTAVVTGLNTNEPYVDKFGRVKVLFRWDRNGKEDAASSCWIRVAQVWAGPGWGATFWPRPGHEVVVAFENGDPDRPLIIGSVYNDHNMPPYALPDQAYVGGVKSCSVGAKANPQKQFNYVQFDDQAGSELLLLHSEGDVKIDSEKGHWHVDAMGHFHRTGGVPSPGYNGGSSSSGGSSGAGDSGSSDDDSNSRFQWDQTPIAAASMDYTLGFDFEMAIGAIGFFAFGMNVEVTFNPLGGKLGEGIMSNPWAAAATVMGGDVAINLSSASEILYGPFLDVHRGAEVSIGGAPNAVLSKIATAFEVASVGAMGILAFIHPSSSTSVWFDIPAMTLPTALPTAMAATLIKGESAMAIKETTEMLNEEVESLLQHTEELIATATITSAAAAAIQSTSSSIMLTVDTLAAVSAAGINASAPAAGGVIPPTLNEISDFPCLVGAQAYTIVASASTTAPGASFIHINAMGSGSNGDLFVTASRSIDIRLAEEHHSYAGLLALTAGSNKLLMNPSSNTISLGYSFADAGTSPACGMVVTSTAVTLQSNSDNSGTINANAATKIALTAGAQASSSTLTMEAATTTLTSASITLQSSSDDSAPALVLANNGSSLQASNFSTITLTAGQASIELSGGNITIKGASLNFNATSSLTFKGLNVQVDSQGFLTTSGSVQKQGGG